LKESLQLRNTTHQPGISAYLFSRLFFIIVKELFSVQLSHEYASKSITGFVMTIRVAVYGTLKKGLSNAHYLQHAQYLGTDCLTEIVLYDLGPWPGARLERSLGIDVEVYEIDTNQLQQLDELEDYDAIEPCNGMYDRIQIKTRYGLAWVYLYLLPVAGRPQILSGGWLPGEGRDHRHMNDTEETTT
tara:strand:+ start:1097 stop:1657 length:561 start_codon:yes stop_codon:yes gene_type:complete